MGILTTSIILKKCGEQIILSNINKENIPESWCWIVWGSDKTRNRLPMATVNKWSRIPHWMKQVTHAHLQIIKTAKSMVLLNL